MLQRVTPKILVVAVLLLWVNPAWSGISRNTETLDLSRADQNLSRGGLAIKSLVATGLNNGVGFMVGGQGVGYVTEAFYMGGAAYGGTLTGRATGSGGIGYGGVVGGYEGYLAQDTLLDMSLLVGAGGGDSAGGQAEGGFILEPSVGIVQKLGSGVQLSAGAGILYFPGISSLSGISAGIAVSFKKFSLSFEDNS